MAHGAHGTSLGPHLSRPERIGSGEASARPGLQLALATFALAVQELLREFALVAARNWPVGAQFPLSPSPTLAATGPAGREVAQIVVIEVVVELFLGARWRAHLRWRRLGSSRGTRNGRVHGAGRLTTRSYAQARIPLVRPVPPCDWLRRGWGVEGGAGYSPDVTEPENMTFLHQAMCDVGQKRVFGGI